MNFEEFLKSNHKTGKSLLKEMPQYYRGKVSYQKDSKFIPISMANFKSYEILGEDAELVFCVDASHTTGFVFAQDDVKRSPRAGMVPLMRVALRETPLKGYKQAYALRIQERASRKGIATSWYLLYVNRFGGIVSDFEHLEGGKILWKSFLETAALRNLKISTYNFDTGELTPINAANISDEEIWSEDDSKRNLVIVLEK